MRPEHVTTEDVLAAIQSAGHGAPVTLTDIMERLTSHKNVQRLQMLVSAMATEGMIIATRDDRYRVAPKRIVDRQDLIDLVNTHTLALRCEGSLVTMSRIDAVAGVVDVATCDLGWLLAWATTVVRA